MRELLGEKIDYMVVDNIINIFCYDVLDVFFNRLFLLI